MPAADYAVKAAELADAYRDRADLKSRDVRNRAELFWRLNDGTRNITQIRSEVDANAMDLTIELITADGEIDALRVELAAIQYVADHA